LFFSNAECKNRGLIISWARDLQSDGSVSGTIVQTWQENYAFYTRIKKRFS